MNFPIYYDKAGKPIKDTETWARMLETEARHVGLKKLWFGSIVISTVWLGIDHDFSYGALRRSLDEPNPHPIIFETMVFIRGRSGEQWRYRTIDEAEAGHKRAVRKMLNPVAVFKMWREYR